MNTNWLHTSVPGLSRIGNQALAWGQHIIWGDTILTGDLLFVNDIVWGANIVWGTANDSGSVDSGADAARSAITGKRLGVVR